MRGLAGDPCAASGTDFWFVGSGAVVGQRGRVYLTNPEPAPAVVDVTLYGPDGPIDAPDGRGVTVAAGSQEVRLLDALAPGHHPLRDARPVRQGRIAAAVARPAGPGSDAAGCRLGAPAAAAGAASVRARSRPAGGRAAAAGRGSGDPDAIVRVRLVGASGAFAPTGLDVIEVRAGSVTDIDIAEYTGGEPVTVELESTCPSRPESCPGHRGAGDLAEIAYAAAAGR